MRTLIVIADNCSLNQAAKTLGIRQSTLSRTVQRLEAEFRCTILVRTPRGTALTRDGERLVASFRRILDQLEVLRLGFSETSGSNMGEIALGSLATVGTFFLPPLLATFKLKHPQVQVMVTEEMPEQLAREVARGELDLAISDEPIARDALVCVRLWKEPFIIAVHPEHPLAQREQPLSLSDLLHETFISFPGGITQRAIETACKKSGLRAHFSYLSTNLESMKQHLEAGAGIALLPRLLQPQLRKWRVRQCSLNRADLERSAVLVSRGRPHMSRAARALHREIIERAARVRAELTAPSLR